jgi:hypothetical protein
MEITEKLQAGVSVAKICGEFHVAKQTVSDIKKNKDKVKQFTLKFDVGPSTSDSVTHRKNISYLKIKIWKKQFINGMYNRHRAWG